MKHSGVPRCRAWLLLLVAAWAVFAPSVLVALPQAGRPEIPAAAPAGRMHNYLYANADGVNNSDPSGHFTLVEASLVAAAIGTIAIIAYPSITTGEEAQVEAHFDRIGQVGGSAYHHAYLLLKGKGRPTILFRGGPSGNASVDEKEIIKDFLGSLPATKALGFGFISTAGSGEVFSATSPDYPDKPEDDVAQRKVPNIGSQSYFLQMAKMREIAKKINSLHIEYHPASQNSNSVVNTMITHAGLFQIDPPVWAPAWHNVLYY